MADNDTPPDSNLIKRLRKNWRAWTIWLFSATLLASFGNAIWEMVVRPIVNFMGGSSLFIVSSLFRWYNDDLYATAAMRPHALGTTTLLGIIAFVLMLTMAGLMIFHAWKNFYDYDALIDSVDEELAKIRELGTETPEPEEDATTMKARLETELEERRKRLVKNQKSSSHSRWWYWGGMIYNTVFLASKAFSVFATADIITDFDHQLALRAPEYSEVQRLQYQARFAQVKTKADFDSLMAELKTPPATTPATATSVGRHI